MKRRTAGVSCQETGHEGNWEFCTSWLFPAPTPTHAHGCNFKHTQIGLACFCLHTQTGIFSMLTSPRSMCVLMPEQEAIHQQHCNTNTLTRSSTCSDYKEQTCAVWNVAASDLKQVNLNCSVFLSWPIFNGVAITFLFALPNTTCFIAFFHLLPSLLPAFITFEQ